MDRITWTNEKRKISELTHAEYNPRQLTEKQAKDLDASLERFNLADPIIINADNKIIGGHQRINILKRRGAVEVDVRVPSRQLTEHEEKELNLRLNKNLGEWDFDLLADFDQEMLLDVGFDSAELDKMFQLEPDAKDDEVPEPPEAPISKTGDIWILGRHRVMCGDSTKIDDVEKLMDGKKADMVFTDPPYGMKKEKEGVLNDNLNYDDLLEFNKKWIPLTFDNLKGNGSWYCWGMDEPLMDIYSNILKPMQKQNKITFRNLITWNKSYLKNGNTFNPFGASGSDNLRSYPTADEKCLFVMCGVQGFNNNSDNYFEGYEPIRKYLEGEATKVNLDGKKLKEICGVGMYSHWFTK
ncbi:MAG TPA: DNA methyltransferase, partial [Candidatus Omnitrophota bacterium]|nr:DNA methyltransferase [Candidatus Omnitrophota bacterium]